MLVVGEALVDVLQRTGKPVRRLVGGSPANVAIGLARLGHDVRLATCLGADPDGLLISARLQADGVRLDAAPTAGGRTSTATAVLDQHGSARYSFDLGWDLPAVTVGDAGHLHTGSIAATLPPGAGQVRVAMAAARAGGATTSYDPNLRPQIIRTADQERPDVEALVAASDVVKASDEDLAWLYPGRRLSDVVQDWAALGPALVVLTQGGAGALVRHRALGPDPAPIPAAAVTVVDTVGAGDSFMVGLLSGAADLALVGRGAGPALRSASAGQVRQVVRRAAAAAAVTCSRAGSDPPRRCDLG